ncbi:hypothetical protein DLM45_10790 [Hyphomicrobium methylovorum]|nr:hypothetical protein [Hyphomicrobium methylovorum]
MAKLEKLTTIPDVVRAFGGPSGMAEWAGIGAPAVCNWIDRGHIPPGWHFRLDREAKERGFEIDQCVFDDRLRQKSKRGHHVANATRTERVA